MIKPAHRIYMHLVWTTLGRRPMIDASTGVFLDKFFRRILISERVHLVELAILQTHVHLLIRTSTRFDLPHLLQVLKGGSSYEANRIAGNRLGLRWGREYSVDSVSPRSLPAAVSYLQKQHLRHPGEAIAPVAVRERSASPSTRFSV